MKLGEAICGVELSLRSVLSFLFDCCQLIEVAVLIVAFSVLDFLQFSLLLETVFSDYFWNYHGQIDRILSFLEVIRLRRMSLY